MALADWRTGNIMKKGVTKWQTLHCKGVISMWGEAVRSGLTLGKKNTFHSDPEDRSV